MEISKPAVVLNAMQNLEIRNKDYLAIKKLISDLTHDDMATVYGKLDDKAEYIDQILYEFCEDEIERNEYMETTHNWRSLYNYMLDELIGDFYEEN